MGEKEEEEMKGYLDMYRVEEESLHHGRGGDALGELRMVNDGRVKATKIVPAL